MARINKFVYWTPRILSIAFILFLMLFSLDVFDEKLGFWRTLSGLLIHNIPAFILLAITAVAWKREIVGVIAFIAAGALYIMLILISILRNQPHEWYKLAWTFIISGPAFLIGALYYLGWKRRKNNMKRRYIKH